MKEAIEITTFKLNGYTCAQFIGVNKEIDAWLKKQPGFKSRHIAEEDDGTIIDMLFWASAAQARASMSRLMSELADSPVHAMIDQDTVTWTVATVRASS